MIFGLRVVLLVVSCAAIAACSGMPVQRGDTAQSAAAAERDDDDDGRSTFADVFRQRDTQENVVLVNRYIWAAALETLDFLPVSFADPFTGVIVTDYGTPPGGSRAYRATVLVKDPALDARSLNVALLTRSGPAGAATIRAVEDAILTRARQLRIADSRL